VKEMEIGREMRGDEDGDIEVKNVPCVIGRCGSISVRIWLSDYVSRIFS
jgi:hypothetical protein